MKWIAKFFGLVFVLAGIAVAVFTYQLCMDNQESIPVLLAPVEEAEQQAVTLMDAVAAGDYAAAETMILGNPKLGVDRDPADVAGSMIWDAFVESYSYELVGDSYATDSGIAQNVRVSYLDIGSVTANLQTRAQTLLEQRVAAAEDMEAIYDENNDYEEAFVMEVLEDAVKDALREDAKSTGMEFTINLVYRDGSWVVVSDSLLMTAISGGIVK